MIIRIFAALAVALVLAACQTAGNTCYDRYITTVDRYGVPTTAFRC
ncbi:hypothetical protein [Terrihabitans soli]|nr:hypothetical protein [Terrihabitans soli]